MNNNKLSFWQCLTVMCLMLLATNSLANVEQTKLAILDRQANTDSSYTSALHVRSPQSDYNLELIVELVDELKLKRSEVQWLIFKQDVLLRRVFGERQQLILPSGDYQIELKIGEWQHTQAVNLRSKQRVKPYFRAKVGRLKIKANEEVDWILRNLNSGERYHYGPSQILSLLLPSGTYHVEASVESVPQQRRLHVNAGKLTSVKIDVPVGELSLIATYNNMPLFQLMEWRIYRLEREERRYLSSYHQHIHTLMIPPGRYEVVAEYQGRQRSRQFQVQENTKNRVILALD